MRGLFLFRGFDVENARGRSRTDINGLGRSVRSSCQNLTAVKNVLQVVAAQLAAPQNLTGRILGWYMVWCVEDAHDRKFDKVEN